MVFLKKQVLFILDNIVSLKGVFPINMFFRGFPKKVVSLKFSLKEDKSIEYFKAFDSEVLCRTLPKTIDLEINQKFKDSIKKTIEERFILTLKGARVAFNECFVISKKGFIIDEINPVMSRFTSRIFYYPKFGKLERINGTVAVLSNDNNYFHWMFEVVPKVLLLKKLKLVPDFFVIGGDRKFKSESIALLGIDKNKIIYPSSNMNIIADKIVVPSFPRLTPSVLDFVRKTFLKIVPKDYLKKYEKIYICRGNVKKRMVLNESELVEFLSSKGFISVTLDDLSIVEQANIFNSARVIVAPHGAALSNLVFCNKKTKLIEIFHPDYINVCFWEISNHVGLDYYYFISEKTGILNLDLGMKISIEKIENSLILAKII